MSETARFVVFLVVVLGVWALMHLYVGHRLWRLPWLGTPAGRLALVIAGVLLLLSYPLGRVLDRRGWASAGHLLELTGAQWMGVLFLLVSALLLVDLATGFGFWARPFVPVARLGGAAIALVLAGVATVQGVRAPVVRHAELRLAQLPVRRGWPAHRAPVRPAPGAAARRAVAGRARGPGPGRASPTSW
ncbi:MAG: hypothetical protein AB2L07_02680 [Thermoanaerobaculaceae bacterium]